VRRYATAATPDQLIGGTRLARPDLLRPHQAYLRQRWDEGARSTERLHAELREQGHRGSLRRLTAQLRHDTAVSTPPPPAMRTVASWILALPGMLADAGRRTRPDHRPMPGTHHHRDLVREFADMLRHQRGEHLQAWPTKPNPTRSASYVNRIKMIKGHSLTFNSQRTALAGDLGPAASSGRLHGSGSCRPRSRSRR
jgi:hypothetical protein